MVMLCCYSTTIYNHSCTSKAILIFYFDVSGLNVYSMLKHETLVLTLAAVEKIEEKILYQLHRTDYMNKCRKFKLSQH